MRILAVDMGTKRIGLAISDALGFTAQGLETIQVVSKQKTLDAFVKLCKEREVGEVVVGLPRNMNGTLGPKANEVLEWVKKLEEALKIPVNTWDERLTSREAGRLMIEEGLSRQRQRQESDRLAATLILQNYLESKRARS
jgi:putative holliday junction resolvase